MAELERTKTIILTVPTDDAAQKYVMSNWS